MIVYNHYIKFIPELKNEKKVEGSFVNTITIKESSSNELEDKFKYKMSFPSSQGRELSLYSNREFMSNKEDKIWAFEVKEVITFFWHSDSMLIEYIQHKNFTEYLLNYWLFHVVMPVFFIIEGIYDFLHAGSVEIEGDPILFIAPSMGGKSTMTDYFIKQGHTMISDDKVAIFHKDGHFYAVPSYPYHRPYRNMEDMGKFVNNFAHISKKMNIVYLLEKVSDHDKVKIEELTGIEKFKALRDAKEMNLFFHEFDQLEYLAKIGKEICVFKVTVPWNLKRINEVYHAIIQHHSHLHGVS